MTVYLGIDYGKEHLGLALADGPLATQLTSLNLSSPSAIDQLTRLVVENKISQIIIGLPEGQLDKEVKLFGNKVQELTGVSVVYHPETLSTKEAIAKLRQSGASRNKLKNDHLYAACLILEDYLETVSQPNS